MDNDSDSENDCKCSIGRSYTGNTSCTPGSINTKRKQPFKLFSSFTDENQKLLKIRSGCFLENNSTICYNHESWFLKLFEKRQVSCCDPFSKHILRTKKNDLRAITFEMANQLNQLLNSDIKPGQKLCKECRIELSQKLSESPFPSQETALSDQIIDVDMTDTVSSSLVNLGISPLKTNRLSRRDRYGYTKRKISDVQDTIATRIATVGGFSANDFMQTATECTKCDDLDEIIHKMKEKYSSSNRTRTIQILTLLPKSWTIEKTIVEFGASHRMVQQARKLAEDSGILAIPDAKRGRKLAEEIEVRVRQLFESDEYSRICPGKKDFVSVQESGQKVHKQKRLLLCNLKELFLAYREKYGPEIGFSKFCVLRPPWCISVGPSGTHTVCVCLQHQNVKLMLSGCAITDDYKSLIGKTVCNIETSMCMLQRCDLCPGKAALQTYLDDFFPKLRRHRDDRVQKIDSN